MWSALCHVWDTHYLDLSAIAHGKLQQYAVNIISLWNVQLLPQHSYVFQHSVTDVQDPMPSYDGTFIWRVHELTRRRRDAVLGNIISLYSAPFFTSRHGYKLCLCVYLNGDGSGRGTHVSFFITLMKGEFDPLLPWPFKQTVSLSLLAQDGMSRDITQSFKPDEDSSSFQMPNSEMNVASGCPQFCSLAVLDNPAYVQNDTIYLKGAINLWGIEHILWLLHVLTLYMLCHCVVWHCVMSLVLSVAAVVDS